jgi:hypothetical protein
MSSEYTEVLKFIEYITEKLRNTSSNSFSVEELSNSFLGLRLMTGDSEQVSELLKLLSIRLKNCDGTFSGQQIVDIFSGLSFYLYTK